MDLGSVLSNFSSVFTVVLNLLGNLASWVVQTPVAFIPVCMFLIAFVVSIFWRIFMGGSGG